MENSTGEEGGPSVTIFSDRPRFVSETSSAQRKMAEADAQLRMAAGSLRDYKMAFHQNPVGSNAEITRVLLGEKFARREILCPPLRTSMRKAN